jgi:hypothetical protein
MSTKRSHVELASIDFTSSWERRDLPAGFEMKVLADDLDEAAKTGARTRLVRLAPGATASGSIVHDFWEETYLLAGDMVDLNNKRTVRAPIYSLRPPGTPHGPFGSETGCTVLEIQYYVK